MNTEKLLKLYENEFNANGFYTLLHHLRQNSPNEYSNREFYLGETVQLQNSKVKESNLDNNVKVEKNDIRIDMPILLGNTKAKKRIMILGLEPRHTNDFYNIMKVGNQVFATPFGIDRWYSKSKQSIYGSAFKKFLNENRLFLFSDFVKEYKVIDPTLKGGNDKKARQDFSKVFNEKYIHFLEKEIEMFSPDLIIGLGKTDINKYVPKSWLEKFKVKVISHPTNGNFPKMQKAMEEIIQKTAL